MAKIRAYKLAEELGIEKDEFVEKLRALGIELKNALASLEDDEVGLVREKLGAARKGPMVEQRVERKGGAAVIRRRKTVEPEAPPPVPEPVVAFEPEPASPPGEIEEPEPLAPEAEPESVVATPPPLPVEKPIELERPTARESAPGPGAAERQAPAPAGKQQRKRVREVVNLREQEQIARQVTGRVAARRPVSVDPRSFTSPRRKRRDAPARARPAAAAAAPKASKRIVRMAGSIAVGDLARELGAKAADVQARLMALGTMASINQSIDVELARQVAEQFEFEVQDVGFKEEEFLEEANPSEEKDLSPRPPVITVMGHVDHGKTSLLDTIRRSNVVAGEAGGITQHIGAYQVEAGGHRLTFIDTPGHAAFTAMRARGAQVTDIVVLVVAANDGIMPQTVEAIAHARAAGVPIIVAVNKCDLPEARPKQVRQGLMEHGLVPEEFGGDVICCEVSAVKGVGIDHLLEMIALQADVLELKADAGKRASGVVLEAQLDKGLGPLATVLVQEGTLRRGDVMVVGTHQGRVRVMQNERGDRLKEVGPATPVQVTGLSGVPEAGDDFNVVENERAAKQIVEHRSAESRGQATDARPRLTLEEILARSEEGGPKELSIVLKADVQGSVEAVRESLLKLSTDEVRVNVIHTGVGAVGESDVMLARASNAIVIGFHVRPDPAARRAAEAQGVDIRSYTVIYEITDEVRKAMAGLLPPKTKEVQLGRAEVRQTFNVPRVGTIAGCFVHEGLVRRNATCRLVRDGVQVHQGRIGSLKRFKEDVREVKGGFECGIGLEGYNDVKIGDSIEAYAIEEEQPSLG
jgi:translation initiation factor IF-2